MLKNYYVSLIRFIKRIMDCCGVTRWLDSHSDKRPVLWFRSLLSIYDIEDMFKIGLPWWSFKSIDEVEGLLKSWGGNARVFEYGSGASTVWLAARAGEIHSVEHDRPFSETIKDTLDSLANVTSYLVEPKRLQDTDAEQAALSNRRGYSQMDFLAYTESIHRIEGQFDLIIVDGRARIKCLEEALKKLKPTGVLLFDNSDRGEYQEGLDAVPLERKAFKGLTPSLPYGSETTLFYNKD